MTEPRDQLLHLVDRARRGVALPAEHDALHHGITAMAERAKEAEADHARVHERACLLAERLRKAEAALSGQRTATVEVLDASHVTLRRYRERAEQAEGALRDASPILQRALDCLDATCRYHGDRLDPDEYGRRVRSEACCDTGVEPRRAREAKAALARIGAVLDEQPSTATA